ncbi:MAG TPA: glycoside hydrolase family 92 protein, partial [Thermoanaerobaculia bacterium]|nr:glycoside hydrolase family 92 protein [Thermoanaerobaculia bacterium]
WPARPVGELDNVVAHGQTIELPAARAGARQLVLLGAASNGDSRGEVTVTYSDGSITRAPVVFHDWVVGEGDDPGTLGNRIVVETPYRNDSGGGRQALRTCIFAAAPIALDAAKSVTSISLPKTSGGVMHLFAWAFRP